jgi:hypothetical protein
MRAVGDRDADQVVAVVEADGDDAGLARIGEILSAASSSPCPWR